MSPHTILATNLDGIHGNARAAAGSLSRLAHTGAHVSTSTTPIASVTSEIEARG
jgi:hypothetical protein